MSEREVVLALTTVPTAEVGQSLGRSLVEERLAACVNILPPMTSVYWWNGELQQDVEHLLIVKTARDRVEALQERISQLHPYDLPEFIVVSVADGSARYLAWVLEGARGAAGGPTGAV